MALAIQPGRVVSVQLSHPLPRLVEVHLPESSSNGLHLGSKRRMLRGRAAGRYARWTPAEDRVLRRFPVERFIDPVERRKLYNAKIFLGHGRTPSQVRYRYMRLHREELERVFATAPTDGGPSDREARLGAPRSEHNDGRSAPTSTLPLSQVAPRHHGKGDMDGHPHPRPLGEPIGELVDDLTDEILLQIAYALKEARDQVHEAIRRGQAKADEALRRTFQRLMQAVREIRTSVDTH